MRTWLSDLVLGAAAVIVISLLYVRGMAVTKCITAILFSFRTGKRGDHATLNTCTGWVRHAARFSERRTYTFILDSRLSKGEAAVALLDKDKRELLRLNRSLTTASIELYPQEKYYLRWDFQHATGTCGLRW